MKNFALTAGVNAFFCHTLQFHTNTNAETNTNTKSEGNNKPTSEWPKVWSVNVCKVKRPRRPYCSKTFNTWRVEMSLDAEICR